MTITGVCQVTNPADGVPPGIFPSPTQSPGVFLTTSRDLTERVHGHDAKIVLQAGAGFGRVLFPGVLGDRTPVAPSAIPYRWDPNITCREMTVEEIKGIVAQFRIVGMVAREAGLDGVQVHAIHEGHLLDQFAISLFNHRIDECGGSLENRLRFAREVVEAIHESARDDFPAQLRFSPKSMIKALGVGAMPGESFSELGRDIDEGIEAARLLVSYGYEALDVDVGSYDAWYWSHPPTYQDRGLYVPYAPYARQLHEACPTIPLIVAGRVEDPDLAAAATADDTATLVSPARPTLADPDIVDKLHRGRRDPVRPCISCQEGCIGRIEKYSSLRCAVNPLAAREIERPMAAGHRSHPDARPHRHPPVRGGPRPRRTGFDSPVPRSRRGRTGRRGNGCPARPRLPRRPGRHRGRRPHQLRTGHLTARTRHRGYDRRGTVGRPGEERAPVHGESRDAPRPGPVPRGRGADRGSREPCQRRDLIVTVDGEERRAPVTTVVTAIGYTPRPELMSEVRAAGIPCHVVGDARRRANIMDTIWDAFEVASQLEE